MPTPDWVREAARKKRERVCPVCGVFFIAPRAESKGLCSKACQAVNYARVVTGRKQSQETKNKRVASMTAFRKANPEKEAARIAAVRRAVKSEEYAKAAYERYIKMQENGIGICSDEIKADIAEINSWALKKVREELDNDTDYIQLWKATQARLRQEMPYDGPLSGSDYMDYLKKLGKALLADPAIRDMQAQFMKAAIPRIHAERRAAMQCSP
jgi:endogenous inhibitor of DNA gyrase (YacG/DUF329 family)